MNKRLFEKYHNLNCWLFALWGLWHRGRKGSESREFYHTWWSAL